MVLKEVGYYAFTGFVLHVLSGKKQNIWKKLAQMLIFSGIKP